MSVDVQIEEFDMAIHFEPLRTLFASYFPPEDKLLNRSYAKWLYGANPFGVARMVIVRESGVWVGFMAMIPVQLARGMATLSAYYVVNVLVHPQHQGKNIFNRMISAARERVKQEHAALMGHPNAMALKFWQRARMSFHEPLKPSLVVPWQFLGGVRVRDVSESSQLPQVWPTLLSQAERSGQWILNASNDYVAWRYLAHPIHRYRVQHVNVRGNAAGILVTRRVRPGVHMLVDQFLVDGYVKVALRGVPWLTVSFRTALATREIGFPLLRLPIKKLMPFFLTSYENQIYSKEVISLGLSVSDL